uniref:Uncharacterized protein n=1 Tax=Rhizophora mucronata TaxID=61149 RepID=A0A2P2QJJ4_RHIMU
MFVGKLFQKRVIGNFCVLPLYAIKLNLTKVFPMHKASIFVGYGRVSDICSLND